MNMMNSYPTNESNVMSITKCHPRNDPLVQPCITVLDKALKRYIIPHHVHIGSHLAYFCLNYVFIGDALKIIDGSQ